MTRSCEFAEDADGAPRLVVRDTIELLSPRLHVLRMSFAPDLEAAYVAAGRVYQRGVLQAWPDLAAHVGTLNAERRVTIERRL